MSTMNTRANGVNRNQLSRRAVRSAAAALFEQLEQRRLMSAGQLDSSYGTGGIATQDLGADEFAVRAVLVPADGSSIVLTRIESGGTSYGLVRFDANGAFDASFGSGGVAAVNLGSATAQAIDVAVSTAGIYVVGTTNAGGSLDFAASHYSMTGALDTGFGVSGLKMIDFGGLNDTAAGVAIDASGKVVIGGDTDGGVAGRNFSAARLTASGAFDNSFDVDGRAFFGNGGAYSVTAHDVAIDGSGNVVVVGSADSGTGTHSAVARFLGTSGALDATFGAAGVKLLDFSGAGNIDEALA